MADEKLKPCPFCGKAPKVRKVIDTDFWFVECVQPRAHDCPGFAYTGASDRDEAIRRWNTRKEADRG